MFSLGLSSPHAFLKPYSYAFLPVTSTADKRVSISKGINNNIWLCGILARGKKNAAKQWGKPEQNRMKDTLVTELYTQKVISVC